MLISRNWRFFISNNRNDDEQVSDIDSFTKKLTKIANYRNNIFINKTEKEIIELQDAVENINNLFNNDLLL